MSVALFVAFMLGTLCGLWICHVFDTWVDRRAAEHFKALQTCEPDQRETFVPLPPKRHLRIVK